MKILQIATAHIDRYLTSLAKILLFKTDLIYLFGVLRCFQHCTGHITMGSLKGRGNQYIQLVKVLYCTLPTNGKQLPGFTLEKLIWSLSLIRLGLTN